MALFVFVVWCCVVLCCFCVVVVLCRVALWFVVVVLCCVVLCCVVLSHIMRQPNGAVRGNQMALFVFVV